LIWLLLAASAAGAQSLSVKWEELTAGDFVSAIQKSQGTCLLPFGIVEKHGPQGPLGTDLINVRYISEHAAKEEYVVVFPAYYFGQIFEAKAQPGTVAYPTPLLIELLQATMDEMGRNGCKKIIIVNGHGGNTNLLQYFGQIQLEKPHDYVVYAYLHGSQHPGRPEMHSKFDMHAGETETSHTLISRPDLVHLDRANSEDGSDLNRLDLPGGVYTGMWWYARFPNHYAGDASHANRELGEFDVKNSIADLVTAIRAIKADNRTPALQREFYEKSGHPLDTKQ
jgi:creatinine amidohydrolase